MLRQEEPVSCCIHLYLLTHRHKMPSVQSTPSPRLALKHTSPHCPVTPQWLFSHLTGLSLEGTVSPLLFSHYIFYLDVFI